MYNSREKLMRDVQVTSFAMDDTILFLDTHPNDRAALEAYQKYRVKRREAVAEYTGALWSD